MLRSSFSGRRPASDTGSTPCNRRLCLDRPARHQRRSCPSGHGFRRVHGVRRGLLRLGRHGVEDMLVYCVSVRVSASALLIFALLAPVRGEASLAPVEASGALQPVPTFDTLRAQYGRCSLSPPRIEEFVAATDVLQSLALATFLEASIGGKWGPSCSGSLFVVTCESARLCTLSILHYRRQRGGLPTAASLTSKRNLAPGPRGLGRRHHLQGAAATHPQCCSRCVLKALALCAGSGDQCHAPWGFLAG